MQEYWSGLPFPSPGDLPNQGIKPGSLASKADSLPPESLTSTAPVALMVKNPPANAGVIRDWGSIPGRKGKIFPLECRVPKNSQERRESLPQ